MALVAILAHVVPLLLWTSKRNVYMGLCYYFLPINDLVNIDYASVVCVPIYSLASVESHRYHARTVIDIRCPMHIQTHEQMGAHVPSLLNDRYNVVQKKVLSAISFKDLLHTMYLNWIESKLINGKWDQE